MTIKETNHQSPITNHDQRRLPNVVRPLVYVGLLIFIVAWWYAATLNWRAGLEAERIVNGEVSPAEFNRIPLAAEPQRRAAQVLLAADEPDYQHIDALLADAVAKRPLYAPYWLDRAKAAFEAGNAEVAKLYNAKATELWPTRPVLLWKAAMLYTRMNERDAALATLRDFLYADPYRYGQVLAVATRLESEPGAMLDAILPARFDDRVTRDEIVDRILRTARSHDDALLAQAAWRELSPSARRDPDIASSHVEWLVQRNDKAGALAAWRHYRAGEPTAALENGGFEQPLRGGLDWRTWERNGIKLSRDNQQPRSGRYSLKVAFPGDDNAHFNHLRQYLAVEPAATYTLRYAWRGQGITTRSGPYISVRGLETGHLVRSEDRWGTWGWEQQELSFTAPDQEHFVEVRLRRNRTDALDNKIAGDLWLDDFRLTAAGEEGQSG